jgi:hypothetical protein
MFQVLVFNPKYINPIEMEQLIKDLRHDFPAVIFRVITHRNDKVNPFYVVNSDNATLNEINK